VASTPGVLTSMLCQAGSLFGPTGYLLLLLLLLLAFIVLLLLLPFVCAAGLTRAICCSITSARRALCWAVEYESSAGMCWSCIAAGAARP
jgi:hypothetical protein